MPTPAYFARAPPFPPFIPTATLPTLSLAQLQSNNASESTSLYAACISHGFFLLDLRGVSSGEALLRSAELMFDLMATTFGLDQSILEQYPIQPPASLLGYKRTGVMRNPDGTPDAMDVYTISRDDMLGVPGAQRRNPTPIEEKRGDVATFFTQASSVVAGVLTHLEAHLGLAPGTLPALCSPDRPSSTVLRLLRSEPRPEHDLRRITLPGHTDIGLITLLFHVCGGLQILPAGRLESHDNWLYVQPQPGCVLVGLADTLVEWTAGILRSGLHRVVSAPGDQARVTRFSMAFQVKAERGATVRRLVGGRIPRLGVGEVEDERGVEEWAAWRGAQIFKGALRPETRGGRTVGEDR
ncbi:putative oxidoreductase [Melanomma pulvis-pyrius CBS 109.77]|uniref:Putative oxidoreductase n=1 Tax=Melanomma pulvis-pyrius CBS 109.77 TaxID=1314802 RepID=A0A6A6WU88_9PLEO|nr:putative oxidoreductase [Melanomma pulvis-pyrius CBS 109.77]